MFVDFFFHLRTQGLKVSPRELLETLRALELGVIPPSLERFYTMGRSLMVKRVEDYDLWDQAFGQYFKDTPFALEGLGALEEEMLRWLDDPQPMRHLTQEERDQWERLGVDELRRTFLERLAEQTERHDGGSYWIGTGGRSPFGHGGQHPSGMRVGGGDSGGARSAIQMAQARRFRNLRTDLNLDIRQIGVALRRLRQLTREGREDELDLQGTIAQTGRNGGELEIVMRPPKKNDVKLLLLIDVGGSMTPHARVCSQLFSAAHQATHFKAFKSFYFHNCPYDTLYTDMARRQTVSFAQLFDQLDETWRCIVVGDAAMAPDELMSAGGYLDFFFSPTSDARSGWWWLEQLHTRVPHTVWLNPDPLRYWETTFTVGKIRELFPMYPLTLDGLDEAVKALRGGPKR